MVCHRFHLIKVPLNSAHLPMFVGNGFTYYLFKFSFREFVQHWVQAISIVDAIFMHHFVYTLGQWAMAMGCSYLIIASIVARHKLTAKWHKIYLIIIYCVGLYWKNVFNDIAIRVAELRARAVLVASVSLVKHLQLKAISFRLPVHIDFYALLFQLMMPFFRFLRKIEFHIGRWWSVELDTGMNDSGCIRHIQ